LKSQHNKIFGRVIRRVRQQKNLTQEALAYESELDRTYISLLELGSNSPSLDTIMMICGALDLSFSQLALSMEAELNKEK